MCKLVVEAWVPWVVRDWATHGRGPPPRRGDAFEKRGADGGVDPTLVPFFCEWQRGAQESIADHTWAHSRLDTSDDRLTEGGRTVVAAYRQQYPSGPDRDPRALVVTDGSALRAFVDDARERAACRLRPACGDS